MGLCAAGAAATQPPPSPPLPPSSMNGSRCSGGPCTSCHHPHRSTARQPGKTMIYIPRALGDVFNGTWVVKPNGKVQSAWTAGGAFIAFE